MKIFSIFVIALFLTSCDLQKLDWDKFIEENGTDKDVFEIDIDTIDDIDIEQPEKDNDITEIDDEATTDEDINDFENDEGSDSDIIDADIADVDEAVFDDDVIDEDIIYPYCGDGNKDQDEDCDLGTVLNTGEYGGCNSDCTLAIRCGDGEKNGTEICDDGESNGTSRFCNSSCTGATTGALCTGQTKCYNDTAEITCPASGDFYGQDAQYLDKCVPRSYTISGTKPQEIVTDNNTQLQWQRTLPTSYSGCTKGNPVGTQCSWQESINYCDGLNYGGYEDWRSPNIKEINSLAYFGMNGGPSINSFFFPDTPLGYFWSSSQYSTDSNRAWYIFSFANSQINIIEKTQGRFVRCVRGDYSFQSVFEESEINGKVVVTDNTTGLLWTKEYLSYSGISLTWKMALDHCANLNYAGYSDWRLPNINELNTLIDYSKHDPASSFPGVPSYFFWSSTSSFENLWSTDSYSGITSWGGKSGNSYARCVR